MMSKSLFQDFNAVSAKQWKQKIQVDLKGVDYNKTLIWNSPDGIDVKPFYHADDFNTPPPVHNTNSTAWGVGQIITVTNANDANTKALEAINKGAERILFQIHSQTINLDILLHTITVPVYINTSFLALDYVKTFKNDATRIRFNTDIIGNLAKTGNWYTNLNSDYATLEAITKHTLTLHVDLGVYQNAGATHVQQLAYALAHANEYLNYLNTKLTDSQKQQLELTFQTAIGGNYFFEIAKLKALRLLWASLASEYTINTTCHIIASPSLRNKTIYDYNVNMLRTTTECMSAILGGADTVFNLPYNSVFEHPTEFGERIARNQLLILKNESYFNTVNNPTDGAYYIESLTQQLATKSLDVFKTIEAGGGFLKQLKQGHIQKKLKDSARKEQNDFNQGIQVSVGTNKYPNTTDTMKNMIQKHPFVTVHKRKTLLEPIIHRRLSEAIEQQRLHNE